MKPASPDSNPDSSPGEATDTLPLTHRSAVLRRLILLQAVILLAGLAIAAFEVQTIVVTGILALIFGSTISIFSWIHRDKHALWFGLSAVAFVALVSLIVNLNSWGPTQGAAPVTLMALAYGCVAIPVAIWLVRYSKPDG